MSDSRYLDLAKVLVGYSVALKKGENVFLDLVDTPDDFTIELIRQVRKIGAVPLVEVKNSRVNREIVIGTTKEHATLMNQIELARFKKVAAYIAVRGSANMYESSDVPSEKMALFSKIMKPAFNYRVDKTRWCVLRWPTPSMAQSAGMSTEAFEDFYFKVCTMNYARMARAMAPLKKRMDKADKVHLKAPGTDLRFSIKKIGSILCKGDYNIPDGEVFTAPVIDSTEGHILFNAPTTYQGSRFENIRLEFKQGKIIKATGSNEKRLNEILDTDKGARYIGEFAIGFNPHILSPMGDILFDEKIAGSLHFTPGQAYSIADNGNRSAVHWDMVLIQRPEWGGGEIWFDGELIRKNGKFIPKDLHGLNPENLK